MGYEITTSFETNKATTTHRVFSTFMILQQWTSFGISRATTHRVC
jgi:hypothetical protein